MSKTSLFLSKGAFPDIGKAPFLNHSPWIEGWHVRLMELKSKLKQQ